MQNFKGAIFDMDGTLLDSMPVWKRLTQRYLAQFDVHITDADYAVCEGFSQPQVAEYFLKRYPNLPLTRQQMLDGMDEWNTATHGRTGLMHLLMGSFAETVMRQSHLPLLIIRSKAEEA